MRSFSIEPLEFAYAIAYTYCMAKRIKRSNGTPLAATMSADEIERRVMEGAADTEFCSLASAFSPREIEAIASNENAGAWRWEAQAYLTRKAA